MTTVQTIILFVVFAGIMALYVWCLYRLNGGHLFNYDPTNPFRRYCKKCSACQCMHHYSWAPHKTWWEEMYPIGNDPNCKCHKHADNHG